MVVAKSASAVTPPERKPDRIADPTTTTAALRRIDRPPTPDTVKNATLATISPSRGSVRPPSGSPLVNAASTAPRWPSRTSRCNSNASRAPTPAAVTASKSCQDRERTTRSTPSTTSRTRSPTPPAQLISCSRTLGNAPPAPTRSCSRPLAVPTARVPRPTAAYSTTTAETKAITSLGRRTRPLGGSMTSTLFSSTDRPGGVWVTPSYCRHRPCCGTSAGGVSSPSGPSPGRQSDRARRPRPVAAAARGR